MKQKKAKTGEKRLSSVKRSFDMKGKWKPVELDPHLFSQEGLQDLVCFEELTSYSLVDSSKAAKQLKKEKKREKKRGAEQTGEEAAEPAKKKKKKHEKVASGDPETNEDLMEEGEAATKQDGEGEKESAATSEQAQSINTDKREKKKKNRQKKKKLDQVAITEEQTDFKPPEKEKPSQNQRKPKMQTKNWTEAALSGSEEKNSDVSAWKDLYVPSEVLKALSRLGFTSPTPIQALALPPAIRDRMDILGAAETGKTT
uniref:RNA helicase n=1 Tax=Cyprinodon variegatus TaxID=28743 RepID=A0A3Q2DSZ7_CYPVA